MTERLSRSESGWVQVQTTAWLRNTSRHSSVVNLFLFMLFTVTRPGNFHMWFIILNTANKLKTNQRLSVDPCSGPSLCEICELLQSRSARMILKIDIVLLYNKSNIGFKRCFTHHLVPLVRVVLLVWSKFWLDQVDWLKIWESEARPANWILSEYNTLLFLLH